MYRSWYEAAWFVELKPLVEQSQKYNIEISINATDNLANFTQEIEIKNGEILKNDWYKPFLDNEHFIPRNKPLQIDGTHVIATLSDGINKVMEEVNLRTDVGN